MNSADLDAIEGGVIAVDPSWCTREILMAFFPQPIVQSILIKHHVAENQAKEVAQSLSTKDSEILQSIEKKSAMIKSQPLLDMNQREAAVQLFKETLFEVFSKTLSQYGVKEDQKEITALLDEIQETKGKLFIKCVQAKNKQ